jgi:hypothetical protein
VSQLGEYSGNRNLPNTCNIMNSSELSSQLSRSNRPSNPEVRGLMRPRDSNEEPVDPWYKEINGVQLFSAERLLKQKSSREIGKIRSKLMPHWDPDIFMAVVLQLARRGNCQMLQAELQVHITEDITSMLLQRFRFTHELEGRGTLRSGILTLDEDKLFIPCLLDPPVDFGGLFARAINDKERAIHISQLLVGPNHIRY